MKVSVITPVYNGSQTIKESINSILNQTYKNIELIIINDGSTDDSENIIKSVNDSRIKYYKIKNSGSPARPRNFGIKKSTGDFIAFCDQDDVWYPEKIEKQIKSYNLSNNKSKIGIIATSANVIDKKNNVIDTFLRKLEYIPSPESYKKILLTNYITTCSVIVPRKIFNEVGFLDENLVGVDDFDLWLRITKKYGVLVLPDILCAWRNLPQSLSSNKTKLYLENEKIFDKLELTDKDDYIKLGHKKNLNRILISGILNKDYISSDLAIKKISHYSIPIKIKLFITVYNFNNNTAYYLAKILFKLGILEV